MSLFPRQFQFWSKVYSCSRHSFINSLKKCWSRFFKGMNSFKGWRHGRFLRSKSNFSFSFDFRSPGKLFFLRYSRFLVIKKYVQVRSELVKKSIYIVHRLWEEKSLRLYYILMSKEVYLMSWFFAYYYIAAV